jgi:tetratricopeptide (TPR) repeat protein
VALGEKIRAARLEQKLTQEQLAGRDFSKSYISELERGARTPRLTTLKILARRLGRPLSHFLDGVPEDREAEAFLKIGLAHLHVHAFEESRSSLERALELASQQADEALQVHIEVALSAVDQHTGHSSRALRRLERSLRVRGRARDVSLLATAQACLGSGKLEAGETASAVWLFKAALHLAHQLPHDPSLLAHLYLQLGVAHRRLGQVVEAQNALRQALEVAAPFQDQHRHRDWYLELAVTAAGQGLFEQAVEQAGKALALSEAILHRRRLAEIHQNLAEAGLSQGRWEEAQHHFRWSVVLHGATGDSRGVAQTLGCLAEATLERVSPEAAQVMCSAALELLPDEDDRHERAHLLRVRGTICRIQGQPEEAKSFFTESLGLFDDLHHANEARGVRQELALLAIDAGDLHEARRQLAVMQEAPTFRSVPSAL